MERSIKEHLGLQIAKIRTRQKLTQAQLAESIDVATETISRMERGVSIPSVKTLEKIGHALQIPLKDFFSFELSTPGHDHDRDSELAKIIILLKNKKTADIRLSHQLLKTLFDQLKRYYRKL